MIYKYAFSSLQILSLRSFGLTLKNQKLKVTLRRLQILFAPLKSRQLALRAQTAGISLRSAHNLLYAFFVRSVLSLSCLPFFPLIFLPLILNFQFSILNWQKAYLLKTNKRESISILTGSIFDSRLSGSAFFYYIHTIP